MHGFIAIQGALCNSMDDWPSQNDCAEARGTEFGNFALKTDQSASLILIMG